MSNQIYLVLDNIRSAYNVGSIFRTADAAGVNKIFICGETPAPPSLSRRLTQGSTRVVKTALGAEKNVNWEYKDDALQVIRELKKQKVKIISLEITPKSKNYLRYKFKAPLALVLGSETKGVSKKILKESDEILYIPMFGKKESFNVSIAFAIVISKIREFI